MSTVDLAEFVPESCSEILELEESDRRSEIPALAKDLGRMADIRAARESVPTSHEIRVGDARRLELEPESVDLVVTSPPYLDLIEYEADGGQLGAMDDLERFSSELGRVWRRCFEALIPGGRLCVVVGDVIRSRAEHGRHQMLPLHAEILCECRSIGFDAVSPIIWKKIGNTTTEAGDSARFLGKPYEPGAAVENDIEYILLLKKPGGYRSPSPAKRVLSVIGDERHKELFTQVWEGVSGELREDHPAPFPVEISSRLIEMYSFVGDRVLDPFAGTGTTGFAASRLGRNSIQGELIEEYAEIAAERLGNESLTLANHGRMDVTVTRP